MLYKITNFGLVVGVLFLFACNKSSIDVRPLAALQLVSSVNGGAVVKLNSIDRDSIKAYNAKTFGLKVGDVRILVFPTNDVKPYFDETKTAEAGQTYALYLYGTVANVKGIYVKEKFPPYYQDSSVGVRIINLSPTFEPVKVNLANNPSESLFAGIDYEQITDFVKINLPAIVPVGSVTFQVRSAVTGDLLATYTLPATVNSNYPGISVVLSRNRNITLVIKGTLGTNTGPDAFGIFPVANY